MKSLIRLTLRSVLFAFITVMNVGFAVVVVAHPRYWTLDGVTFSDGTVATGYFEYDFVTKTITDWNISVGEGSGLVAFTYVPANSFAQNWGAVFFDFTTAFGGGTPDLLRFVQFVVKDPLDGGAPIVLLNAPASIEAFNEFIYDVRRNGIKGALLLSGPPTTQILRVDEFYHSALRHYFLTSDTAEKQALDSGTHAGWKRTGESFWAYAPGTVGKGTSPVCRFYGKPARGLDSHFYSGDPFECNEIVLKHSDEWLVEDDNAFQIFRPDPATAACPFGHVPVYRLWNQRTDSNHRYTISAVIREQMRADGYLLEGVVMCVVP